MSNQDSNVNLNLGLVPKKPTRKSSLNERITYSIFKANIVHDPEFYDYSLLELFYSNCRENSPLICEWCGKIFYQTLDVHTRGVNCPYCSGRRDLMNKEAKQIELDKKYNGRFTLLEYNGVKESLFYCNEHHKKFKRLFTKMTSKDVRHFGGCPDCRKQSLFIDSKEVFNRLEKVWKGKLDFSKSEYKGTHIPILVRCIDHDYWFKGYPHHLYNGISGCPRCVKYKGEVKVAEWLDSHNIKYEGQKKFDDLRDKGLLSYDFYIPSKNLLIEYNGLQHYEETYFSKLRENQLEVQQYHDKLKKEYAEKNKIDLLIIRYDEDVNERMNYYFNYKDTIFDL